MSSRVILSPHQISFRDFEQVHRRGAEIAENGGRWACRPVPYVLLSVVSNFSPLPQTKGRELQRRIASAFRAQPDKYLSARPPAQSLAQLGQIGPATTKQPPQKPGTANLCLSPWIQR